jgi:hypothetical protein
MKSYTQQRRYHQEQPAFPMPGQRFGARADAGGEIDESSLRPAAQAERSVMHPDRYDMEWRYCRNGWAG